MKHCLNCEHFEKDKDKQEGICGFPLPSCVKKHKIVIGIFGRFENGEHGTNYHKVGYHAEMGIREIKNCPMWKQRIFKSKLVASEPVLKEGA